MNRLICTTVLLAAVALAGCKREEHPARQRIAIATTIEPLTRAPQLDDKGSGRFADTDRLTLLVSDDAAQFGYTPQTTLYWSELGFAAPGTTLTFAACYPEQELVDGRFDFDLEQAAEKDLLLARTAGVSAGTERTIDLSFRHAMHRLVMTYQTSDPDVALDAIETRCTAQSTCTVDLAAGTLTPAGTRQATFTESGREVRFLLVPQPTDGVSLELHVGADIRRISLGELAEGIDRIEGGRQLHVTLTVRNGRIEFGDAIIEGVGGSGLDRGRDHPLTTPSQQDQAAAGIRSRLVLHWSETGFQGKVAPAIRGSGLQRPKRFIFHGRHRSSRSSRTGIRFQ